MTIEVYFFSPKTLTPRNPSDPLRAVSASGSYNLNKAGEARVILPLSELANLPGSYPAILLHDVVTAVYDGKQICSFTLRTPPKLTANHRGSTVELSGYNLLADLADFIHFFIIGAYYDFSQRTNIGTFPGQIELACDSLAKAGSARAQLNDSLQVGSTIVSLVPGDEIPFNIGDVIGMGWDDDDPGEGGHKAEITGKDSGFLYIDTGPAKRCNSGNWVEVVEVQQRDLVRLPLDAGGYYYGRITNDPVANLIVLDHAVPSDVTVPPEPPYTNTNVRIYNPRDPLLVDDVLKIMEPAISGGWSLSGNTSSGGTALDPDGANVLQMLIRIAEESGDFFRIEQTDPATPELSIAWKTTPDSSGYTLMVPGVSTWRTDFLSGTKLLAQTFTRTGSSEYVSAVTPKLKDVDLSLAPTPTPPYYKTYNRGAWVVYNSDLEAGLSVHKQVSFDGIAPKSPTYDDKVDAATRAQQAAIDYIEARKIPIRSYQSKVFIDGEIKIGQSMPTVYSEGSWDENKTLYIVGYRHEVIAPGPRLTTLSLSDVSPRVFLTGLAKLVREASGSSISGSVTSSLTGGSSPGTAGGASGDGDTGSGTWPIDIFEIDHGQLSGLGDDDHLLYLRADGGRVLTGNLPVDPYVTIDGVDISAHVANPFAHTNPKTFELPIRAKGGIIDQPYWDEVFQRLGTEFSLNPDILIPGTLRVDGNLEISHPDGSYRALVINVRDGKDVLEFAPRSSWSGNILEVDFNVTINGTIRPEHPVVGTTSYITYFTGTTSVPPSYGFTQDTSGYIIYDDTDTIIYENWKDAGMSDQYQFTAEGLYKVVHRLNLDDGRNITSGYKIKYIMVQ